MVRLRLTHHLSSNDLLNYFQCAYTKCHSNESTLLSVLDHIIKALSHQRITALCLLDLSAAFDIIDHSILVNCLSSWLEGYCSFLASILSILSEFHCRHYWSFICPLPLLRSVPQGFVLGSLIFIIYTTPLSSLISDLSRNHHLYADDSQLFISFSAPDFSQNASYLETTIDSVFTWMSANLLSLNQSKTEFLLIGLPKKLSKVSDATLHMPSDVTINPSDSARNLGVIFDSSLTMSDHIFAVFKSFFLFLRDLRRIRSTIDSTMAKTMATCLIDSKVDYCNSLFLSLSRSQLHRLQLILNSTARAVSKTPRFTHISPVLRFTLVQNRSAHTLQNYLNHLQNTPILQAFLSAQSSPYPIGHVHSFFYHCHP